MAPRGPGLVHLAAAVALLAGLALGFGLVPLPEPGPGLSLDVGPWGDDREPEPPSRVVVHREGTLSPGACWDDEGQSCAGTGDRPGVSWVLALERPLENGNLTLSWLPDSEATRDLTMRVEGGTSTWTVTGPPPLALELEQVGRVTRLSVDVWVGPGQPSPVRASTQEEVALEGVLVLRPVA